MPLYSYRCNVCHREHDTTTRGDSLGPCGEMVMVPPDDPVLRAQVLANPALMEHDMIALMCWGEMRRRFHVNMAPVMQQHFNTTVMKPISDMRKFRDELRRESERQSELNGVEVQYEPIDPGTSPRDLGVTSEGLDESNRIREKQGLPRLVLPD